MGLRGVVSSGTMAGSTMRYVGPIFLALSGVILFVIGRMADDPTYSPPVRETPEHVPAALSGRVEEDCVVRVFDIEGMCCGGCSAKLYASLMDVEDVREAAADHVLGTASAVVPRDLDVGVLEQALEFSKYAATLRE